MEPDQMMMQGPPPAASRGLGAPAPMPEEDGEMASPEEQDQYDTFVGMSMMALYDESVRAETVAMLQEGNVIDNIAAVASSIVMRVLETAQQAGQQIGGDVLLHAGREVTELVAEMAEKGSGQDIPEAEVERAFYVAIDRFLMEAQQKGLYTDEDMQGDIAAMQQMPAPGGAAPAPEMAPQPAPRGLGAAMQGAM